MRSYGIILWTVVNALFITLSVLAVALGHDLPFALGAFGLITVVCSWAGLIAWLLTHGDAYPHA